MTSSPYMIFNGNTLKSILEDGKKSLLKYCNSYGIRMKCRCWRADIHKIVVSILKRESRKINIRECYYKIETKKMTKVLRLRRTEALELARTHNIKSAWKKRIYILQCDIIKSMATFIPATTPEECKNDIKYDKGAPHHEKFYKTETIAATFLEAAGIKKVYNDPFKVSNSIIFKEQLLNAISIYTDSVDTAGIIVMYLTAAPEVSVPVYFNEDDAADQHNILNRQRHSCYNRCSFHCFNKFKSSYYYSGVQLPYDWRDRKKMKIQRDIAKCKNIEKLLIRNAMEKAKIDDKTRELIRIEREKSVDFQGSEIIIQEKYKAREQDEIRVHHERVGGISEIEAKRFNLIKNWYGKVLNVPETGTLKDSLFKMRAMIIENYREILVHNNFGAINDFAKFKYYSNLLDEHSIESLLYFRFLLGTNSVYFINCNGEIVYDFASTDNYYIPSYYTCFFILEPGKNISTGQLKPIQFGILNDNIVPTTYRWTTITKIQ